MSEFDDVARRAADRLRADAASIADPAGGLDEVRAGTGSGRASGSMPQRRWLAAAALLAVVAAGAGIIALWPSGEESTIVSPTADSTAPSTALPPTTIASPSTEPLPSTTDAPATSVPPTTVAEVPVETATPSDPCSSEPWPPPFLVGGGDVGTPDVEDLESGERWFVWGRGTVGSVNQIVGGAPAEPFPDTPYQVRVGPYSASMLPVGDPPLGPISIRIADDTDGCVRAYWTGESMFPEDALAFVEAWLAVAAGEPVATPETGDVLTPPQPHYGRRLDQDFDPPFLVDEISSDGEPGETIAGGGTDVAVTARAVLVDGSVLSPPPGSGSERRCENEPATIEDDDGVRQLHPELPEARALNATPDGVVFAGRDVCPDGARWGDDGTRWELVRLDLRAAAPTVEVLVTRPPGEILFDSANGVTAHGSASVSAVSDDGRFVALGDFEGGAEGSTWSVLDTAAGAVEVPVPSACASPGDLIAAPVFLGTDVVVARFCGSPERVVVEVVDLAEASVVESYDDDRIGFNAFSRTVELSAIESPDGPWIIVWWAADLDSPTNARLLNRGVIDDISRPGYLAFGFSPRDVAFDRE